MADVASTPDGHARARTDRPVAPTKIGSPVALTVNDRPVTLTVAPHTSLLLALRNDLGLMAAKYGCGLGECGACTVLVDGIAARACVVPVAGVAGRSVVTLEGLGNRDTPHPVQQAFIDEQAAQCGYCLAGMIVATTALLAHNPRPTDAEVRAALSGNLCRCGTHVEILRAVQRAAVLLAGDVPVVGSTAREPVVDALGSVVEASPPSVEEPALVAEAPLSNAAAARPATAPGADAPASHDLDAAP